MTHPRASTRVSPGFTLFRHSSPSFGSQHVCSHSDHSPKGLRPADCAMLAPPSIPATVTFIPHRRSQHSPVLAHMLDSLVRVSRRGKENHFVELGPSSRRHRRSTPCKPFRPNQPSLTQAGHSAPPASEWGNMTRQALVSFASFSAISGTL